MNLRSATTDIYKQDAYNKQAFNKQGVASVSVIFRSVAGVLEPTFQKAQEDAWIHSRPEPRVLHVLAYSKNTCLVQQSIQK